MRSLSIVIHGEPGTGKSWLAATAPEPRLILDSEGGARFTPCARGKVYWDPANYAPPDFPYNGEWDTCIVNVTDWSVVERVVQWLTAGTHPFRSVVLDSLTEMQKRVIDQTSGIEQPNQQQWGTVLRVMEDHVRKLRDLAVFDTSQIECVAFVCLSHLRDGKFRPYVKGQLELTLPGFTDVVGCMRVELSPDGGTMRRMTIAPIDDIDAKDRTDILTRAWGPYITEPNLEHMIQIIDQATGGVPQ